MAPKNPGSPMRIIDISMPISPAMVQWPGDPRVQVSHPLHLAEGDPVTLTAVELCTHSGTHVDAPSHFFADGPDLDSIPLNVLVGPVEVVDAPGHALLDAAVMQTLTIPEGARRVLFRTDNSARRLLDDVAFREDFAAVSADGARWLVNRGVRLVGIDYLSIGPHRGGAETHKVLLAAGVVVVEGVSLAHVTPGWYDLVCLPLRMAGLEGAPARAILLDRTSGEPRGGRTA